MTWPFENDTSAITKKLAKESLKSEKRRNFMIIIAISLAAFLMSMCGTLFFAFQESQNNMATFQASYDNLTEDKIEKLRHQPEIEMVASLYNLGEIKIFYELIVWKFANAVITNFAVWNNQSNQYDTL